MRPSRQETATNTQIEREIALEQGVVGDLYARLDDLRRRAEDELVRVRKQTTSNTPGAQAERDAFDVVHSQRIWQLGAVEDRLVFGRLDRTADARHYVGRIGLTDEQHNPVLLDWRAPAAASFYQATAAQPGDVIRRRHLALAGRDVVGIDDDVLIPDALDASHITVTGDGALMTALTAHRTGQMRDIVATLQAEQDSVVRAPLEGVLVVSGGPGTGKTAVALHRAAYVLYTHRERIARSGVLVIGPSPVFLRYIENVLPALGETGVLLRTLGTLFPEVTATTTEGADVARIKGDQRMAEVLRRAIRQRQRVPRRPVPVRTFEGHTIQIRPKAVDLARSRARQTGKPHNEAWPTFVKHLLEDLARQVAEARDLDLSRDPDLLSDLMEDLRENIDVRREVNLCWLPQTPEGMLTKLFSRPDRLADAAEGILSPAEQRLLIREPGAAWTLSDVPLLDEVAELVGEDPRILAAKKRAEALARQQRSEALDQAHAALAMSGQAAQMMTAEMLADRFGGAGENLEVADRAAEDRSWTFGHAVIDEAQELSAMAWRLITRRVPSRSMTIVGDLAQTGNSAGARSWDEVRDVIQPRSWNVCELTINYRTPAKVMAVAAAVAKECRLPLAPPVAAREGDYEPTLLRVPAVTSPADPAQAAELGKTLAAALRADDLLLGGGGSSGGGQLAVITPRAVHAALTEAMRLELQDEPQLAVRVSIYPVNATKGLEFDAVIVLDPDAILAESEQGASDLYVALTRCTQRLTVATADSQIAALEQLS